MRPQDIFRQIKKRFNADSFHSELITFIRRTGAKVAYATLLLYHSYQSGDTPSWAKRTILGSIAYLLAPVDLIPDLTPFLGFSDDFGVLMFGLVSIAGHITPDIREKAQDQIMMWFPRVTSDLFEAVDAKL